MQTMISGDPQVEPLIQVFELFLLRDATLEQMREPTSVATRAMLDSGMSPDIVLRILEGALQTAVAEILDPDASVKAEELREQLGPWMLAECFDTNKVGASPPLMD